MKNSYDAAIIGLGPAGILAAHALADTQRSVLVADRSATIGGAAFATDVNLQNITGFPPQSDFGDRTLGSRQAADDLANESYRIFRSYGLPSKPENSVDRFSYPVDEPTLKRVMAAFCSRLEAHSNVDLHLGTTLDDLAPGTIRRWRLSLTDRNGSHDIECDHIILATGKLSAVWMGEFLHRLGISHVNRNSFALGFRVEELASTVNPAARERENPKIRIVHDGVVTETFCWCKNGGVMTYDFGGARLLDGEHFYGRPQANTSFGVITNVELPAGASNTRASVAFSRYVSAIADGQVLMQRLGDFRQRTTTTAASLSLNSVRPSLDTYRLGDLPSYFPSAVVDGFLALLDEINVQTPGAVTDDALIYAPILERIFPDLTLTSSLESSRDGLYFIGDCSGKGVGVAPAAVMGLAVARHVSTQLRRS